MSSGVSPERMRTCPSKPRSAALAASDRVGGAELLLLAGEAQRGAGQGCAQRRLDLVGLVPDHHHDRVGAEPRSARFTGK